MTVELRLREAGLNLDGSLTRLGSYVPGVWTGNLAFVSGQTGTQDGLPVHTGVVGESISLSEARASARLAAINSLTALRHVIGDLELVRQVARLTVYINATRAFQEHPEVADAATDVLEIAFGAAGRGARSALGVHSLPQGAPVELDLYVVTHDAPDWSSPAGPLSTGAS